ncbi:DUF3199 family protein [Jeotgalibacillus malaysiensis]|uniref:protein YqbG n=1 Tax=Jeotgalibacillus malaysiensis TaxID=1508404 RepID=UPI00384AC868
MLLTPTELKESTSFDTVKEREEALLANDIIEAEVEIQSIVGHDFSGPEYEPLPQKVKLAMIKMAQFYALINSDESIIKGFVSEKIGDYSYTLANGSTLNKPDVTSLLRDFIKLPDPVPEGQGSVKLRMRSL